MMHVHLSASDIRQIGALTQALAAEFPSAVDEAFLDSAALRADELPLNLRRALHEFRTKEPHPGVCIISGYRVPEARIGATPPHWHCASSTATLHEELYLALIGSLLGDLFAWATQQDGRLIHDVLPIREHEHEQLGSGSAELLWWHSEDAFHPYRADYLALMCLRNPDRVPTTISWLEPTDLEPRHRETLFEERYVILPDESHLAKNGMRAETDAEVAQSFDEMNRMRAEPTRVAILSGARDEAYLRLDPYFMPRLEDDPEAAEALDRAVAAIDGRLQDVVLENGDVCILDNYRVVHGRKPFKARYDGTDRWLKRINVARDLRKPRAAGRLRPYRTIF